MCGIVFVMCCLQGGGGLSVQGVAEGLVCVALCL